MLCPLLFPWLNEQHLFLSTFLSKYCFKILISNYVKQHDVVLIYWYSVPPGQEIATRTDGLSFLLFNYYFMFRSCIHILEAYQILLPIPLPFTHKEKNISQNFPSFFCFFFVAVVSDCINSEHVPILCLKKKKSKQFPYQKSMQPGSASKNQVEELLFTTYSLVNQTDANSC